MENEPTTITQKDVEKFLKDIIDGKYDPKNKTCFKCEKKYFQNYGDHLCDECYFAQFPKDVVERFYRSFFEYNEHYMEGYKPCENPSYWVPQCEPPQELI